MRTKEWLYLAIGTALVTVSTMMIQVPTPTQGYIHVGDGVILLLVALFGTRFGAIAAGAGSALADLLSGYFIWGPFSLVIKAVMALVAGRIMGADGERQVPVFSARSIAGALSAAVVMIAGYFIAKWLMVGDAAVAATGIPSNCVQGFGGVAIYLVVGLVFERANLHSRLNHH